MKKISNKAQIGTTMTLFVATIVIAMIILIFAFASSMFSVKSAEKEAPALSYQNQAHESLLNLMEIKSDNLTVADMMRLEKFDKNYTAKIESLVSSALNLAYSNWHFSTSTGLFLGNAMKNNFLSTIEIPDTGKNIQAHLEILK